MMDAGYIYPLIPKVFNQSSLLTAVPEVVKEKSGSLQ
jgi:hypothetical protein